MKSRRAVLVIDDFPLAGTALSAVLESDGFEVTCCGDGASALAAASEKHFDIIITDYRMPVMNGVEAASLLRMRLPFAFIVGVSSEDKRADFLLAGADAFLLKPYRYNELLTLIKSK